ncbi:MAG: O-antigen ligase family protein [Acidobacteriaceae bacterium]|nr:O-antigen ligase family protein [Acidobacteriaceae bacterium]
MICMSANVASSASVYPNGVTAGAIQEGVYPGSDAGSCCWLARSATLTLPAPSRADALVVTIFIPTYALAGDQQQTVTANVRPGSVSSACCLGVGIHELAFALSPQHGRFVTLTLRMSHIFVPARAGIGSDRRELSVLLRGIEWRNTIGGSLTSALDPGLARALLALYAVLFVCVTLVTYCRPVLGAALMIGASPFALYLPLDDTTLTLPKAVVIAVALGLALRRPRRALLENRAAAALLFAQLLLALTAMISLHNAEFHGPVWREFFKEVQYLLTGLVAFVAYRLERSGKREEYVRVALLITTTVVSLAALAQEFTGAPMGVFLAGHMLPRIAGPLEGPNQLAAYLGIALPLICAFGWVRRHRAMDLAVLGLGCLTALLTFSRGGITALIVALALVFFLMQGRRLARAAFAIFGVVFAVAFVLAWMQFFGVGSPALGRIAFGAPAGSQNFNGGLGTRAELWHGAYVLWRSHPMLGIGAGNYELRVAQTGAPGVRTHANSAYFHTLAEEGLLGFAALVLLAFVSIRVFSIRPSASLAAGMLAALAALWFHQITDYVTFYPKVGVLLWTMLGLAIGANAEVLRGKQGVARVPNSSPS